MNQSKIIIKSRRNIFFKLKKYVIKIDGAEVREISYKTSRVEFNVSSGRHTIEIGDGISLKTHELVIAKHQIKILKISPALTFDFGIGVLLGIATISIIIQSFILKQIAIPVLFFLFIPALLIKKRRFSKGFDVAVSML